MSVGERKEIFIRELEDLPEASLQEALDFIRFLKDKATREYLETASLSESALSKDWLSAEEDEAWRSL